MTYIAHILRSLFVSCGCENSFPHTHTHTVWSRSLWTGWVVMTDAINFLKYTDGKQMLNLAGAGCCLAGTQENRLCCDVQRCGKRSGTVDPDGGVRERRGRGARCCSAGVSLAPHTLSLGPACLPTIRCLNKCLNSAVLMCLWFYLCHRDNIRTNNVPKFFCRGHLKFSTESCLEW